MGCDQFVDFFKRNSTRIMYLSIFIALLVVSVLLITIGYTTDTSILRTIGVIFVLITIIYGLVIMCCSNFCKSYCNNYSRV